MNKLLASAALVAMMATGANAADLQYQEQNQFNGFYAGAFIQGTTLNTDHVCVYNYGCIKPDMFTIGGGINAGYNFGFDNGIVIGAEIDGQWFRWDASAGGFGVHDTGFGGSARIKAGYAFDNILIYGTAGYSKTRIDFYSFNASDSGFIAGAGVEILVTDRIGLRLEGLYLDELEGAQGRAGFNFHF